MNINQLAQVPVAANQIIPIYDGNSCQPKAIVVSALQQFVLQNSTSPQKLQIQVILTANVPQTITGILGNQFPTVEVWDLTNGNKLITDSSISVTSNAPSLSPTGQPQQTMTVSSTSTRTVMFTFIG
jgi:hypothetical protein